PILENVPTWRCAEPEAAAYVLAHLEELVVKEVHGSGGYGMLIGPKSTAEERAAFAAKIKADPDGFIAQPTLELSATPTLAGGGVGARHVDFRPYCLVGKQMRLTPGGLTRVALREGSLVVNSSQGGGVKDTWVLSE
ncbi:MAG: circularly permuted type 2 ATP-grasp protein, partial [Pseudomonadota bacterium]